MNSQKMVEKLARKAVNKFTDDFCRLRSMDYAEAEIVEAIQKGIRHALRDRKSDLLHDLGFLYCRLDHLMTVYEEGCMAQDGIDGPHETMVLVSEELPRIRKRYGFKKAWPRGRIHPACLKPSLRKYLKKP